MEKALHHALLLLLLHVIEQKGGRSEGESPRMRALKQIQDPCLCELAYTQTQVKARMEQRRALLHSFHPPERYCCFEQ